MSNLILASHVPLTHFYRAVNKTRGRKKRGGERKRKREKKRQYPFSGSESRLIPRITYRGLNVLPRWVIRYSLIPSDAFLLTRAINNPRQRRIRRYLGGHRSANIVVRETNVLAPATFRCANTERRDTKVLKERGATVARVGND